MAKKNRKEKKSQSERKAKKEEEAITWDDIAAMSDSDDEGGTGNGIELNTKAKTLQQSITKNIGSMLAMFKKTEAADEEEFEEDVLDGSSSEEGDEDDAEVEVEDDADLEEEEEVRSGDEEDKEGDDEEKTASFIDKIKNKSAVDEDGDSDSDSDSDEEDEEDEEAKKKSEQYTKLANNNIMNSKALSVVATELNSVHSKMPWAETFVIVPATPLPFGENGDPESNPLDIHDDLKREVAFYNSALEAVNEARPKLEEANIPFTRPDDFFAEMIKTDDHMANVKDRLIFENKKIEAVAQRKSNKEQKLRAKESHANRLAEKSKRKRDHFQELDDWASSAAKNRGGALRDDVDDYFLNNRYNGTGPGKKRMNADKKFGFGGKNGRFKQNDRKSMNDMSGFNPRGNFAGGMKKTSKNGSGANRSGKRARDARRSRS
eukprot:CAMPEP_0116099056 /NCGR_PEP_ID=MMETSP0327-20121206/11561_1 /TAXON_ID=44447 /ORGANISM="Pseudo-nitzschia delicatissima, Strain B596" /LENGTH=432 /DNA_ID=CAMNT_0003590901 /DNA_START=251 /DNA_END=1549 /DNA_ORIENTATION=+